MRAFNINDGLVSNQVRGFYQDSRGFIWIMTWEGLSRHDGYSFRNYTLAEGLAHPLINDMIEDEDGRIFVAENDGTVDVIQEGEVKKELRTKYGKPINTFMRELSGRILAPSDSTGVGVFNEGTFTTLNKQTKQFSVSEVLPVGDYFIVCGNTSGVMQHDHRIIKLWPDTIEYNCIIKDNLNRILVGTSEGLRLVNLLPGSLALYELIPTEYEHAPWSRWTIHEILQTSDHSIWLATIGGLIQIKQDHSWRLYNRNDGLPTDYITSLFEDKAGFLWIGTDQGIAKLDIKNTIDLFTIGEELPNSPVSEILPEIDGSALVISNRSSLLRITLNQPLQSIALGNPGKVYDFLIVGNDTLVSTNKGRYKLNDYDIRLWTDIPYSLAEISLEMANGCIFSTVTNKMNINCSTESYADSSLSDQIGAIARGSIGVIWVATLNEGMFQILVKNVNGKMELELNDFNDYLPEKTIRSLHVDAKGNIWIGTRYSGLIQMYRDSLTGGYSTHIFNRSKGFISDFIRSITSDVDGNIWIGTHAGIEKLIPTENGYRIFSFSQVHNFFATVIKIRAGPDKSIWCITASGVVRIKDSRYETTPPSEVYITTVSTDKLNVIDPVHQLPFDLKYNENFIGIEFSSNDHINGRQLKYSYRLNGSQDTSWSEPIPIHKVSFANLLPGNYNFEVRTLGWDGTLGKTTFYKFKIRPPFWQQTWFVLLSILAFLAFMYSLYRYRISQLKRIQDVRDRIASDLHDEIGSSLTHVNILSEIGKKTSGSQEQPQQLFKRIGEEVQSCSEALDDIIWSVSSRADTTEDLVSRMRRYASELFDAKGISFSLHEDHLDVNQSIGLELRRDFYLIYKEILRNIVRHAEATEVMVRIKGEDSFLWMRINDNGHGFDPDAHSDRQGLHSIRGRVAKWKGHISIDSSSASGTEVRIGLPIRSKLSFRKS